MRTLLVTSLALLTLAASAQAGQWVIEETDDNYVVEYSGESKTDKTDKKTDPPPAGAAAQAKPPESAPVPAVSPAPDAPAQAKPVPQRPTRVREPSRRERVRSQQPDDTPQ